MDDVNDDKDATVMMMEKMIRRVIAHGSMI